jgi:hypothetical protein
LGNGYCSRRVWLSWSAVGFLVEDAYRAEAFGLRLPSLQIIIGVQLTEV